MENVMTDPCYQTDFDGLANELRRTHGPAALDIAIRTAKQSIQSVDWKNCAMWLQVANRLNAPGGSAAHSP